MCSRHALRPSKVSPHLHVYLAFFGFSKPSVEASWHCGVTFSRRGVGWAGIDHTKQWEGCNNRERRTQERCGRGAILLLQRDWAARGQTGQAEWASVQESGTPTRPRVVGRPNHPNSKVPKDVKMLMLRKFPVDLSVPAPPKLRRSMRFEV